MGRAGKGSDYEREVCKMLSKWWTQDLPEPRDDIFWRSSQSGGRATQRSKKGLTTYGSYGDIAAVDPIGDPLMKVFTIELKRGSSHESPFDLIESNSKAVRPFGQALLQAVRSHKEAGSQFWMLIVRRDRKLGMVYVPRNFYNEFNFAPPLPSCAFRLKVDGGYLSFVGCRLCDFLGKFRPKQIIRRYE